MKVYYWQFIVVDGCQMMVLYMNDGLVICLYKYCNKGIKLDKKNTLTNKLHSSKEVWYQQHWLGKSILNVNYMYPSRVPLTRKEIALETMMVLYMNDENWPTGDLKTDWPTNLHGCKLKNSWRNQIFVSVSE